jgi:hypothetical protein
MVGDAATEFDSNAGLLIAVWQGAHRRFASSCVGRAAVPRTAIFYAIHMESSG